MAMWIGAHILSDPNLNSSTLPSKSSFLFGIVLPILLYPNQ
jgi:hypothetical protein